MKFTLLTTALASAVIAIPLDLPKSDDAAAANPALGHTEAAATGHGNPQVQDESVIFMMELGQQQAEQPLASVQMGSEQANQAAPQMPAAASPADQQAFSSVHQQAVSPEISPQHIDVQENQASLPSDRSHDVATVTRASNTHQAAPAVAQNNGGVMVAPDAAPVVAQNNDGAMVAPDAAPAVAQINGGVTVVSDAAAPRSNVNGQTHGSVKVTNPDEALVTVPNEASPQVASASQQTAAEVAPQPNNAPVQQTPGAAPAGSRSTSPKPNAEAGINPLVEQPNTQAKKQSTQTNQQLPPQPKTQPTPQPNKQPHPEAVKCAEDGSCVVGHAFGSTVGGVGQFFKSSGRAFVNTVQAGSRKMEMGVKGAQKTVSDAADAAVSTTQNASEAAMLTAQNAGAATANFFKGAAKGVSLGYQNPGRLPEGQ